MTKLLYCLGLVVLSVLLWSAVFRANWVGFDALKPELVTLGLQVLVFGIAGGGIKLLLDQATAQREFRSEVLQRLGQAHKEVYRVRRLLEISSGSEQRKLIGELMDARQELGGVFHDVRLWLKPRNSKAIQGHLEVMRAYLKEVIEAAVVPDQSSPKKAVYEEFLRFSERGRYNTDFKAPYRKAKRLAGGSFEAPTQGVPPQ